MAGPNIALYNETNSSIISSWSVGTVKAEIPTTELKVHVWNNRSGVEDVSDLKECVLTVLDANGSTTEEDVAKNKWVECNIPSIDGDSSTWTKIGGTDTKAIRANNLTINDGDIIRGTANNGVLASSGDNVCSLSLRVNAPINSEPGNKSFKVRITGYYT